jgi:CheY-like chemotaxis protein
VLVDPVQLDQVLLNLAVNARDAMPNGGTLTFGTERATFDRMDSDATPELEPGEYVRLLVGDTGSGMSKATLENVFEPFFTTKERGKGTGLGLSTCYGIVRQAKGVIGANSVVGEGTTFEILLPRAMEGAAEMSLHPVASGIALRKGQGQTVLVVDDEPHVVAIAARVLSGEGYRVLTASEPAEAADVAAAHSGDIAVVLTDVVMPGKNGRTFAEDLKRARPSIAVVYMSGYSDDVVARHGVLEPNIDLLCKPFTPDALVRKIAEALENRRARAASAGQ